MKKRLIIIWVMLVTSLEIIKIPILVAIITKGKIGNKHNLTLKMYSYQMEGLICMHFSYNFHWIHQSLYCCFQGQVIACKIFPYKNFACNYFPRILLTRP